MSEAGASGPHTYGGHRAYSFRAADVNELVELRARHRTFDGAYRRTALGNLGYSIAILRLFDHRFYRIGLLYAILSGLLVVISFFRARTSRHDFADKYINRFSQNKEAPFTQHSRLYRRARPTVGQENTRVFGRPFITAGWIVVAVAGVVAVMEIGLFILVLRV
ncbi:hypothetical protein JAAARDRAFT_36726 [Jaapia argillacea MUCL 33604]|uniref:DUF202 domain-containing protein n=1 Tax=Jaapia argillacea MUCL 33604 TaxID=933084 RepID=A0A067PXG4_9AGAM|nr:hypothetical protein JAAARDRAFT_36726 [Jaapia argillacea MUCL 33604]